jgi:CDP-diacylglycerol--glycerol-3-phosphate 3-phosphatidyltransferase
MNDETSTASASTAAATAAATAATSPPRVSTFGPSALLTPANGITGLRLLATPLLIALIMVRGANWVNFVVWGALSFTDGIDGWVARRHGTTRSGAFLDPLADKVVVLGALFALVAKSIVWWLPVAIIAVREVYITIYRSVVGRKGVSIPARTTAKVKTLFQSVAVALCLVPPLAKHHTVLAVAIWVATILTVFTGGQYYLDGRKSSAGRRHASDPKDGV